MAEGNMGVPNSKPNNKLYHIDREVSSVRSSIRSQNRKFTNETKDQFIHTLVRCSNEANSLKGKVKRSHWEEVQTNISHTMEDVLSRNPEQDDLDMGSVETSSFVQLPVNKRQTSNRDLSQNALKKQKNTQVDIVKNSTSTLQDIEEKLKTIKPQINVAIEQKDLPQLRVYQQIIKVLVTELEMIEVKEHTPLGDRKEKLDKSIMNQYRKIEKTMKEIRRSKDINYLTNQNKRIKNELEDIQKEIAEINSFLGNLVKTKDQAAMNNLKENVLIIRQRLSSIESVDESTKQLQKQLFEELNKISRTIEENARSNVQNDLTKAQMNYEDIIKNIASGNSINKNEIKVKLQSLQSFIDNIKEEDDAILRQKQQLLNNVRQSFSFILNEEQKLQNNDPKIDIKEANKNVKELDKFRNYWLSLQKSLNSASPKDYSKVDEILSDIQKSIEETRYQIAERKNLSSNLNNKLNHSTPNLSSTKSLHSKFGSSLSVDLASQSLIKTRAKVYNLSAPRVQNINDQPVVLRNKQFYKDNNSLDDGRPFSKLEEIKTQVNYIKEKFKESQQKQHLKNKLESYIEIINGYVHHQNQRIAHSARSLLSEIQDMMKSMTHIPEAMNATPQRRASIELSFENVVGIQRAVEDLEKAVANFKGKADNPEYRQICGRLVDCQKYLRSIEIPPTYDMIQQQKDEILTKIEVTFNTLQSKCFNYYEDEEGADTRKKLERLKEKVNRFAGAYKGILYNQIEKDLNKLLLNVTETVGNKTATADITKDIEKHLKILEHKATKDQSFRRTLSDTKSRNEEEEKLVKLKSDLLNIKTTIDTTPTNAVNLFTGLKSRLDLVKLGLDQLKFHVEEEEKQKDILYNEVETLKNVVEAKISLAKQAVREWPLEQDKEKINLEQLGKIEEGFRNLKPEIESFVGTTSDNKFYELDENSIKLILKMDKLQFERGSEAHNRKLNLLKEIYSYGDLLDQRAKEREDLLEIERNLHDADKNFARNLKLNDLDSLEKKVVDLKIRLNNGQFNSHLQERKHACLKGIEMLFEKISANKNKSTNENVKSIDSKPDVEHFISSIELQFGNIKKEIDNYSHINSGNKYYELNSSLTALFFKLDSLQLPEGSELRPRKIVLLKEIRTYTEILHGKVKEGQVYQEINKHLNSINKKVDNYRGENEELKTIENELKSVQMKMQKLNLEDTERKPIDQKLDILIGEYTRFKNEKQAPKTRNVESQSSVVAQNFDKNVMSQKIQGSTSLRLAEIESELYLVRKKVDAFINTEDSEEYKTIEDTLLRLKMRLNKLETERNSELIRKQNELDKRIQECFNILDERSLETANIMEIEVALDSIHEKFKGEITSEDKTNMDEQLISLQVKLGKLHVNNDLLQRKNLCGQRIINSLKQLKEKSVT